MRFVLAFILASMSSQAMAEYLTLECEIKQHIILREHEPVDGKKLEGRMFFSMSHDSIAIAADWAAVYSAICK